MRTFVRPAERQYRITSLVKYLSIGMTREEESQAGYCGLQTQRVMRDWTDESKCNVEDPP